MIRLNTRLRFKRTWKRLLALKMFLTKNVFVFSYAWVKRINNRGNTYLRSLQMFHKIWRWHFCPKSTVFNFYVGIWAKFYLKKRLQKQFFRRKKPYKFAYKYLAKNLRVNYFLALNYRGLCLLPFSTQALQFVYFYFDFLFKTKILAYKLFFKNMEKICILLATVGFIQVLLLAYPFKSERMKKIVKFFHPNKRD